MQADLFAPPREPVDARGHVCGPDDPVETWRVPVPGTRYSYAQIDIAQHTDGRWMWGTHYRLTWGGGGYRVGPKWGQFADTREAAIREALVELEERVPAGVIAALKAKIRAAA